MNHVAKSMAHALGRALSMLDAQQGRVARNNARSAVREVVSRVKNHVAEHYPVIPKKPKPRRRRRVPGPPQGFTRYDGSHWAGQLVTLNCTGIRTRVWRAVVYVPAWVNGARTVKDLLAGRRSAKRRKEMLTLAALLGGSP
jgi:hypothetical protein